MADYTVALIGNPNVGKSTLFNRLTGLHQHTGNWPGKTVERAQGSYSYKGHTYRLVDLPGTYTAREGCGEETVTAAYLRQEQPECVLVLCDATCLERSLILALQLRSVTRRLVVGVNLMDEARRRGVKLELARLRSLLGVPVVGLSAGNGQGIAPLQETVRNVCQGYEAALAAPEDAQSIKQTAERAARIAQAVTDGAARTPRWERRLDRILMRPITGAAAMFLLLWLLLWLTIQGASAPSELLQRGFTALGAVLKQVLAGLPPFWRGLLLDGLYATTARVVSVMLPPMAIFFPLFTLLEDIGLLPRLAFLLDRPFQRCGSEGRMALTMCMGLGCNAAGVTGCRIIPTRAEREIAMITNALIPCNGRIPALILLAGVLGAGSAAYQAGVLVLCLMACTLITGLVSLALHKTVYRGKEGGFLLELPPYRKPRVGQVLVRSMLDRTLFVLGRAVVIAAPAGVVLWLLGQIRVADQSLLVLLAAGLGPAAALLGLSGALLLAFVLAIPAGELVLPVTALILGGDLVWTWQGALCAMAFFLFHWPCGTTLATIRKESGSGRVTLLAALVPTAVGVLVCTALHFLLS